ncbi:MAG: hypothetical protein LBS82_04770 [Spirochaetaceae bacterium]|jgi:hypothetical protein|nr:hypothetical protein [Spirochaetaceae bacterium]
MANVMRLELYRPISYVRDDALDPFNVAASAVASAEGELLFCFQAEPLELQCAGFELYDGEIHEEVALPAGRYCFAQERELLARRAIADMAAEIRRFAAGDGCELENKLYLRYLFEDGKIVTQLFHPHR